jgi:hypothetical protein
VRRFAPEVGTAMMTLMTFNMKSDKESDFSFKTFRARNSHIKKTWFTASGGSHLAYCELPKGSDNEQHFSATFTRSECGSWSQDRMGQERASVVCDE